MGQKITVTESQLRDMVVNAINEAMEEGERIDAWKQKRRDSSQQKEKPRHHWFFIQHFPPDIRQYPLRCAGWESRGQEPQYQTHPQMQLLH